MKEKFYICRHCGNLIGVINASGVPVVCCGENMQALVPNTTDAAFEKHLPVVAFENGVLTVNIGEAAHPMTDAHYIAWVYVQTANGGQRKALKPNDTPTVSFCMGDDKPIAVYAYCNLHGLWKTEIK